MFRALCYNGKGHAQYFTLQTILTHKHQNKQSFSIDIYIYTQTRLLNIASFSYNFGGCKLVPVLHKLYPTHINLFSNLVQRNQLETLSIFLTIVIRKIPDL
jgi:hypothetical protein